MKKACLVICTIVALTALYGCSSGRKSVTLKLSPDPVTPVYLPDSSLLSGNDASESLSEAEESTPFLSQNEMHAALVSESETDAPYTETTEEPVIETEEPSSETAGSVPDTSAVPPVTTASPTTAPPATAPPTTAAPPPVTTAAPPVTTAPPASVPATAAPTETQPPIEHRAEDVQRIEILTLPDKTVYDQYQEPILFDGLTILAVWEDGYEAVLTKGFTVFDVNGNTEPVTSDEGEYTMFVRYGSQAASFTVLCQLAENIPLDIEGCFHAARKFYVGESLRHICLGAWVGGDYIPGSQLTFSQEKLDKPGLVTVTVSWKTHKDERTFAVLPQDQYELTMEDLEWLSHSDDTSDTQGMKLTAAWFYERLLSGYPTMVSYRPLPSDVIPEEEFHFTPEVVTRSQVQQVTVDCRGLSYSFWIGLY